MRPFATLADFFAAVLAGRFAFAAFFAVRFLVAMVCSWVKGPQRPRLDRASPPCLEAGLATRALRWGFWRQSLVGRFGEKLMKLNRQAAARNESAPQG